MMAMPLSVHWIAPLRAQLHNCRGQRISQSYSQTEGEAFLIAVEADLIAHFQVSGTNGKRPGVRLEGKVVAGGFDLAQGHMMLVS